MVVGWGGERWGGGEARPGAGAATVSGVDRLATVVGGVDLRRPVLLAAGTAGYLDEMGEVLDLSSLGGVVTKSITLHPREGNATWRILEAGVGMLNAIGLANVGLDHFLEHIAPRIAGAPCRVIASVAGFAVEEYVRLAAAMDDIPGLAAVELNVSCPNVHAGTEFGADARLLRDLIAAVRPCVARLPLWVKLGPVPLAAPGGTMVDLARAAIEGGGKPGPGGGPGGRAGGRPGADALTLCNTFPAMAIDVRSRRPRLANNSGGLSGPGIHPIVVRLVHEVHRGLARDLGVAIVAAGGVTSWASAAEFVLAGASAVQIGTGNFADPGIPARVVRGLDRWVKRQGAANLAELVGKVERY